MMMDLSEGLATGAREALRLACRSYQERHPRHRGATMRPGPATPMWNELAVETRRLIRKRGEKVNLGRFLGVPRQRVHQYLMERSAGPDAERTLRLLLWVRARRAGITLS